MSCARRTNLKYDLEHDKIRCDTCVSREDSDQHALPHSLRVICTTSSQGDFVCFPARICLHRTEITNFEREREGERETGDNNPGRINGACETRVLARSEPH